MRLTNLELNSRGALCNEITGGTILTSSINVSHTKSTISIFIGLFSFTIQFIIHFSSSLFKGSFLIPYYFSSSLPNSSTFVFSASDLLCTQLTFAYFEDSLIFCLGKNWKKGFENDKFESIEVKWSNLMWVLVLCWPLTSQQFVSIIMLYVVVSFF